MKKLLALSASLLVLTACSTTLSVAPVEKGPQNGVVYALPMTQFNVEVVRQVASCEGDVMKVKNTFNIEKVSIEDPGNVFVIKPDSLSHFFNSASTSIEFHEGSRVIKSFNATAKDNTGPALSSVIKGAAGVLTVPSPFGFGGDTITCWDEGKIKEKLAAAITKEGDVKKTTAEVEKQILTVAQVTAEQTALLPGSTASVDSRVAAAVAHLMSLNGRLAQEQKALVAALKPITFSQKVTWPTDGETLTAAEPIRMPEAALEKWIGPDSAGKSQILALDINMSLRADSSAGRELEQPMRTGTNGLFYRSPAKGALIFTGIKSVNGVEQLGTLYTHKDTIAQLGYVNSLSIDAGPFESVEYSAEFNTDGGLKSAGYKQTASPSAAVSSLLDTAVEQYRTVGAFRAGQEQAKLDAELKTLQTELAIKEVNSNLNPAETTEAAQTLTALTAETTLLNAQIAQLEAQKKLLELQGP